MRTILPLFAVAALLGGCARLTSFIRPETAATQSKAKGKAGVRHRLDAKGCYLKMREIDDQARVLLASEQRRLRRAKTSGPASGRHVALMTSLKAVTSILAEAERELKGLEPVPVAVKPLYVLRVRQVHEGKRFIDRALALDAKGRFDSDGALARQQSAMDRSVRKEMIGTEARLRKTLGLAKIAAPSLGVVRETPGPRRYDPSSAASPNRTVARGRSKGSGVSASEQRFVQRLMIVLNEETARNDSALEAGEREVAALTGEAYRARRREIQWTLLRQKQTAGDRVRALGTPPIRARRYIAALLAMNRQEVGQMTWILSYRGTKAQADAEPRMQEYLRLNPVLRQASQNEGAAYFRDVAARAGVVP